MLSLLLQILKTEGLTGAFKGFSASMINTFSTRTSTALRSSPDSSRSPTDVWGPIRIRVLLLPHPAPYRHDPPTLPPLPLKAYRPPLHHLRAPPGCTRRCLSSDLHHPRSCDRNSSAALSSAHINPGQTRSIAYRHGQGDHCRIRYHWTMDRLETRSSLDDQSRDHVWGF